MRRSVLDKLDPALLIMSAVVIACIGAVIGITSRPTAPVVQKVVSNSPRYETQRLEPMVVVIPAGGIQTITSPLLFIGGSNVTVRVRAASPVDFGFLPSNLQIAPNMNRAMLKNSLACLQSQILTGSRYCSLPKHTTEWTLVIVDDRTAAGVVGSGLGALFGVRRPAETEFVRNDVSLEGETVVCVANCQ